MVACPFHPSTRESEQTDLCELEASLVYRVGSRPARASERNSASQHTYTNTLPPNTHTQTHCLSERLSFPVIMSTFKTLTLRVTQLLSHRD